MSPRRSRDRRRAMQSKRPRVAGCIFSINALRANLIQLRKKFSPPLRFQLGEYLVRRIVGELGCSGMPSNCEIKAALITTLSSVENQWRQINK